MGHDRWRRLLSTFISILCLSSILCILLSFTGCSLFQRTKRYTIASNSDKSVSYVSGSNPYYLGIVFDNREFLLCDYEGTELGRLTFESEIVAMDVMNDSILLGFGDNHVEEFRIAGSDVDLLCKYSFDCPIETAAFTDREYSPTPEITVLLANGELWKNDSNDLSEFSLIDENVASFAYDMYTNSIVYNTTLGELRCFSINDYMLTKDLSCLQDVILVENACLYLKRDLHIRFLVKTGTRSLYIQEDMDKKVFSLCDVDYEDYTMIDTSNSTDYAILYSREGKTYYEGSSYNERHTYGVSGRNPLRISIPEGYKIHTIMGGVIFYNDHEVKVLLIN